MIAPPIIRYRGHYRKHKRCPTIPILKVICETLP